MGKADEDPGENIMDGNRSINNKKWPNRVELDALKNLPGTCNPGVMFLSDI